MRTRSKEEIMATQPSVYEKARDRVMYHDMLEPYADTILYDWPEGDEHWEWVYTVPASEIVDWAETVGNS
jgi:hypothetical protein